MRPGDTEPRCMVLGCLQNASAGLALSIQNVYCRRHIQHKSRHGSLWHGTYRAEELGPYLKAATRWIAKHKAEPYVAHAITALEATLFGAGEAEIATRLRGLSTRQRARIAFARLREAGIAPERLLATYLAVCCVMLQDRGTHSSDEFRLVQVAKAVHRLASGYHRRWSVPLSNGLTAPLEIHKYPRSSGRVLRLIGAEIERACEFAAEKHQPAILELKSRLYGPHPSTLPGWLPEWRRKLDAAREAARMAGRAS